MQDIIPVDDAGNFVFQYQIVQWLPCTDAPFSVSGNALP